MKILVSETARLAKENIPRYRSVQQCFEYIKELDGESLVTRYFIRALCREGKIPHFANGKKLLVSLDGLIAYLNLQSRDRHTTNKYFKE